MSHSSKLLAGILCVLLINVPARGRRLSRAEKKCLKKFPVLAYDPYQELCYQKCLWRHQGLIKHNQLTANSLKFVSEFNELFGKEKTAKFQKCLAKSLTRLTIKDCFDMMKIKSCFLEAHKSTSSPRFIILGSLYVINSLVGSVVQPLQEGIVSWLYGLEPKS
ncbi:unnamed protein product [Phyllotreta striolata]|uniref:Uncharacterized protein n=1 Tax=Phyllotreta striolata TaxID=444603 RepID=A0A9N9TLR9_PHYSR|nr:unnamed protein product [Phyllotreta striolata]